MTSVALSEVASVVRGVSFDKSDVADSPEDGFVPILRAGNIEIDLNLIDDLVWVPGGRVSEEQRMRAGDIAICMSSGSLSVVGKTATLKRNWCGSVGAFCAIIRPDAGRIEPDFLAFFLKSDTFRGWTRQSSGANIKNIRKTELEAFELHLPPLPEQQRIVDQLSRAEGIVRLRREAQRKTAELVPALFLDMFGDPASNPKGWPVVALGDYLSIQSSVKTPDLVVDAHLPCIGADSIESATGRIVSWPTVEEIRPISGKYQFEKSDVLYSKIRPVLRKAIIAPSGGYCSADMYPLRPNELATAEFVVSLLLFKDFTDYAIGVSMRAQMPKVNRETLFAYKAPLPPIELQRHFAAKVNAVRGIAAQQTAALAAAQATFDALLHQSFQH